MREVAREMIICVGGCRGRGENEMVLVQPSSYTKCGFNNGCPV